MFQNLEIGPLPFVVAGLLVGFLIGILATVTFMHPPLAKAMARVKAVALLSIGVGLLIWGIFTMATDTPFQQPFKISVMRNSVECIAWGAGFLTAGIFSFILGFVGVVPKPRSRQAD